MQDPQALPLTIAVGHNCLSAASWTDGDAKGQHWGRAKTCSELELEGADDVNLVFGKSFVEKVSLGDVRSEGI